ncbi:subtilisin-like serine protease [Sistotremastrum suecicum HHB10207 ss-3]|uniref:Subtilisin-like serine protease n=1 Tax=Sistotremastrum suecicum HHB10207 ss-3 TaxID=1314776 RepID=A0A166GNZ0_9AGAM|nr:subtilisin-like serine protease [Sistotremastrum suecicum HHB10207 ss-3]
MMACAVVFLSLALSTLASPLATSSNVPHNSPPFILAPVITPQTEHHNLINDSYIVMLKPGVLQGEMLAHLDFMRNANDEHPLIGDDAGLQRVYNGIGIQGYAGTFSEATVEKLRTRYEVDYIEKDQIVRTMDVQKGAPWGLARVSHRKKLGFGTFTRYEYDPRGGEGVTAYVVDTGVNIRHVEFEGRASWGKTIPKNDVDEDGNGHGTHCAGTIASRRYGVAKAAEIVAVKVLGSNGSGSMSDVVDGVIWAAEDALKKKKAAEAELAATGKTKHKGSVANMSLGGGASPSLDRAVNAAVDTGLHFAVAAGNDNKDACNYSPAAAQKAVTVGASTITDERAYFSNHGSCVDVFAPGLNILSTWTGSSTAVNRISGTSMASPHTAGLLAYLLSIYPDATFDPVVTDDYVAAHTGFLTESALSTIYRFAHSSFPAWFSTLLPLPHVALAPLAPTPKRPEILSPPQLKKALLSLATKDRLSDLPPETVNLLIFNNATSA